jgi:hypothetical protein
MPSSTSNPFPRRRQPAPEGDQILQADGEMRVVTHAEPGDVQNTLTVREIQLSLRSETHRVHFNPRCWIVHHVHRQTRRKFSGQVAHRGR